MNQIAAIGAGTNQNIFSGDSGILGKDDFLKILVTQLQNQDPGNPMNADQFASQLAEFSSLEQLQNMNTNLEGGIELDLLLNQAINNTMATTLIGKNVRALGNQVTLPEGGETTLYYKIDGVAQDVTIEIKNENGDVVRTIQLSEQLEGNKQFVWNGKNDSGEKVDPGNYTFSVSAKDVEGNAVNAQEFIVGLIDSIRYENGSASLLIGALTVNLADVLEIGFNSETGPQKIKV